VSESPMAASTIVWAAPASTPPGNV
jgi:hypothetical protein